VSDTRHPDSPQLLAWLDRELNSLRSWQVTRHVERCWHCRGRVAEIETAITAVAQVLEPAPVEPVDVAKAHWKFRQSAAAVEESIESPRRRPFMALIIAGGAAALCIAVLSWRTDAPRVPAQPGAATLLAAALSAENPPVRGAVREERFTFEYRSGTQQVSRRELRLLASPRHGAWTARWSTEDGELQDAVFASDSREFTRSSGLRRVAFRKPDAYQDFFEHAPQQHDVERMILSWIRAQVWQPVSLAREVAEFCTRSGAVLRISTDGGAVLWTAESTLHGVAFKVHLEAVRGQAPAVLRFSWESRTGSGMVQMKRESRREYDDVRLAAALLYPIRRRQPATGAIPLPEAFATAGNGPSLPDLLATEVAVLQALHRASLCKADEVRIVRTPDAIEVSGGFTSEKQVERIEALLPGIPHLRIRLTTLDLASVPPQSAPAPHERHTRPAAVEPWLRSRLGVGVRASEREMFNIMNAVVRDSEDLLADSWALFRLSRRFPPEVESEMNAETRAMVREMADDHIVSMSVHLAAIDGRLALQQPAQPVHPENVAWQTYSNTLHEQAKQTAEVLLNLFASGDTPRSLAAADPEHAGAAVLIGRVRSMATHVRAGLSTGLPSARR
jgi:hypothetical protein